MTPQEFLTQLVKIYSPSSEEKQVTKFIVEQGEALGFTTADVDESGNAILTIGSGTKEVVLLGHIDTVPGDLPVKVEKNVLHGRGSVDAKGPFATFVFAALAAAPQLKNIKITVVGAVEEETGGRGAQELIKRIEPAAAIIGEPSDWEGVTLGYKGLLVLEYSQSKTATHSANMSTQNVIEDGVVFVEQIRKYAKEFNADKGAWGGLQYRIEKFDFSETEGIEQLQVRVKFRTPLGYNHEQLKQFITSIQSSGKVEYLASWGTTEACLAPKNTPVVRAFLKSIRIAGGTPKFKVKTGTADMNTFLKAFPTVPMVSYGPGDSTLDHTPEERLDLTEYEQAIEVLTGVLLELDKTL